MVRGKSLFVSLLAACGAAPSSAPSNHAAQTDCAITGVVMDSYTKEPASGASVVLTGPGLPREAQRTDDAGHFTFAHAAGRTHVGVYYKDRPAEEMRASCGELRVEIKPPTNLIDI